MPTSNDCAFATASPGCAGNVVHRSRCSLNWYVTSQVAVGEELVSSRG